jgi:hypothetical protein
MQVAGVAVALAGLLAGVVSAPGAQARTKSKSPIEIGFDLTGNAGSNQSSTASAGVNPYSSGKPFAVALTKWVNSHGGLGGRPIRPVYYAHNFTSPTDFQSLCTTYFQNNHVFAVIPFATSASEYPCFKENNAVLIGANYGTRSDIAPYAPNIWLPDALPADVYVRNYAIDVVQSHWVKKGAKVGMIYSNNADIAAAVQKYVIPYLKSHGIKLTDTAQAVQILDVASFQEAQVPTKNAVLRFKSEHISQVLIPAWGEYNLLIWLRDAGPQNYYPAMAFGDGVVPGRNVKQEALLASFPTKLYDGSILVGTGTGAMVNRPILPVTRKCQAIYASEGVSLPLVPSSSDSSSPMAYADCQNVLFLKQVMDSAKVTGAASFKKAADALGTKIEDEFQGAPGHYLNSSSPYFGEHETIDYAYHPDCTCFEVSRGFHKVAGYN